MKKTLLVLIALPLAAAWLLAQGGGSLTPPGAPGVTMKTLDEMEPRVPLIDGAADTAAVTTSDGSYHFIINQPGSYYLTGNLGVTKTSGIQIDAEGVTLDLNGFEISRASGTGGSGIEIPDTSHGTAIRTGSIKGFAYGIQSSFSSNYARGCAFRDLSVSACTTTGILAGDAAVIESCIAHNCSGSFGISASTGSSLTNCTASNNTTTRAISAIDGSALINCTAENNTGTWGIITGAGSSIINCSAYRNTVTYAIFAGAGSSLTNCSAYNNTAAYGFYTNGGCSLANCSTRSNTSAATFSAGFRTEARCTISHCTANSNYSTAATLTSSTGMGFHIGFGSTIQNCMAAVNRGDGISVIGSNLVTGNICEGNGVSGGDGAGIHATSNDNRIEGNNVSDNVRGIDMDAAGNVIIRNSASGNTTNYAIAADNVFGEIVDRTAPSSSAVSGNSAASSAGTTDPWANFSY